MAARVPKQPVPIGQALAEFLDRSGLGKITVMGGLSTRWAELLGSGIAGHARPDSIRGGVLSVIVDSSVWMNQLSLLAPDVIKKLNQGMGGGEQVKELRFRIGAVGPGVGETGAAKKEPARIIKRKPSPEEIEEIDLAVGSIADPEIRKAARKMLAASCSRKGKDTRGV